MWVMRNYKLSTIYENTKWYWHIPLKPRLIQCWAHSFFLSSPTYINTVKFWRGWIPEAITSHISRTCKIKIQNEIFKMRGSTNPAFFHYTKELCKLKIYWIQFRLIRVCDYFKAGTSSSISIFFYSSNY